MSNPTGHYRDRLAAVNREQLQVSRRAATLLTILVAVLVVTAIFTYEAWRGALPVYPAVLAGILCAALLPSLLKTRYAEAYRLSRLADHLEAGLARTTGQPPLAPRNGEEFRESAHLYDRDLDILGPHSLFATLASVRTHLAERHLARTLLHLPRHDESLSRQHSIQTLTSQTALRERIALLGDTPVQQVPANLFEAWLDEPPLEASSAIRPTLQITSALLILGVIAGAFRLIAWPTLIPNLAAILACQAAIALFLRSRVQPILERASRLAAPTALLRQALTLMQSGNFADPSLQRLQSHAVTPADAQSLLARLETQLTLLEQRTREWFYIPGLALCIGTRSTLAIESWRRRHSSDLRRWLDAWAEFEVLNALATYAFEHPSTDGHIYPDLLPPHHPATYEATHLAHPLLPPQAVTNSIALNSETRFYLISGSNMAGKSTLLRSLGLNAVLAAVGAPIRATSARLSPFRIGASLALTDSLADGKSKFLAEVERLTRILGTTQETQETKDTQPTLAQPTLFLIDEIFSGTNSLDRRTAAQAILIQLLRHGAVGALSTHDLTLTALADLPGLHGLNLHMASPDPADPLAFDYLLKPGINQASNALAILRMMGLEA